MHGEQWLMSYVAFQPQQGSEITGNGIPLWDVSFCLVRIRPSLSAMTNDASLPGFCKAGTKQQGWEAGSYAVSCIAKHSPQNNREQSQLMTSDVSSLRILPPLKRI